MTIVGLRKWRGVLTLVCAGLVSSCAQDKEFEGITVSRNSKDNKAPYIYDAIGPLDFAGQNPVYKARKVMLSACPQGQPTLMFADAPRFKTETSTVNLLVSVFTCNQPIPGVG